MGGPPLTQKTIDAFEAYNAAPATVATAQGVRMADIPTAISLSADTHPVSCTIM